MTKKLLQKNRPILKSVIIAFERRNLFEWLF
nr:MAG TPA: hypothetical protein [Caudoviricetes sp.]